MAFGEHSRRYFHMIVKFMDAGYIVAADDHVGHGKTAMYNDTWGDWGDAGFHTMMEDEHKLKEMSAKCILIFLIFCLDTAWDLFYYERFCCKIWRRTCRNHNLWYSWSFPWCYGS